MKTIEECVVTAMDGSDIELFPYLPYILQDLWEIGSDPDSIIKLINKHCDNGKGLKILDLGCGKGAISVKLANVLGCNCYGIDAIPEFIEFAKQKAIEYNVGNLCTFEAGDIREKIKEETCYDIVILGSIGPVFGDYFKTLTALSGCIKETGIILIDDGYIEDDREYYHPLIQKRNQIIQQIDSVGMQIIDELIITQDNIKDSDEIVFEKLRTRCYELIEKYPDKKELFINYIQRQIEENDVLENKISCSTLVIKKK